MTRRLFITSTGTGVGKTLVTTSLCWQLRQSGQDVVALKPVISGYDEADLTNDSAQIVLSSGIEPTPEAQANISPWRYRAPLAPNMAAAREGHTVSLDEVVRFCQRPAASEVVLVEGVGGIMVPLNTQHTVLDWMVALGWPVVLVAGNYLGAISHTLCAVAVLQQHHIPIQALVVSESEGSGVSLTETIETLQTFLLKAFPIVEIPRILHAEPVWKQAPPLSWLCQKTP